MDGRSLNRFLATFLIAAAGLSIAWFAVDGLAHLDELMAVAGSGGGLGRVALRHFSGLVRLSGATFFLPIGLASALLALVRSRRPGPLG